MKRNRMLIKRRKRKGIIILIVVFCLILPITAIYLGLRITEMFVSPVLNSDDLTAIIDIDNNEENNSIDESRNNEEKPEVDVNKITETISPLSVFTIQIASLAEDTHLDGFIGELNSKKLPHLIYKMDNSYKVYVIGGTKRTHVEGSLEDVRSNYPDAYINEIHSSTRAVEFLDGENIEVYKTIISDINEVIILMQEQGDTWYNFYKKEGELDTYIELLKKQQTLLSELSKKLAEVELPESFPKKPLLDKMIVFQEGNINRSLEFFEEDSVENAHRLHSLYLDNLFRIVEIIKG